MRAGDEPQEETDARADEDRPWEDDLDGNWRDGDMDDSLPEDALPNTAAAPPYRGLPILDAGDATATQRSWVIDGIFARGETSLLIAPPFGGKSALAADMAHAVASGRPWFGRTVAAPGPVLIVAGERAPEMARRLAALADEHEATGPVIVANGAGLDLRRKDAFTLLRATVAEISRRHGPPVVLIFDTLASLTPGADEVSARDMTLALSTIGIVRDETSAHVMVLHHTPRDNPRQSRGHSSVDGAVDLIVSIDRPAGKHRWRVLSANALAEPFPGGEFEIGSHPLAGGGSVAILRPATAALSERDAAVLAALRAAAGKPIVVAELTRALAHPSIPPVEADTTGDRRRKAVDRSLQSLAEAQLAVVEGQGKNRTARCSVIA